LNDLIRVNGDLTLDGILNVSESASGVYGAGIYRLIDYTGTFTDHGLQLGLKPAGTNNYLQTSIAQQVNLINTQGLTLNYWDGPTTPRNNGVIDGGAGTWLAAPGNENWTQADGLINAPYQDASVAVFTGTAGTVTVDDSLGAIRVAGIQFAKDGYRIEGDAIELIAGQNDVRVGDGTALGAGFSATIASELTGAGRLTKTDLGTLVLTGVNTYTGGTTISDGTLVGSATSFGAGDIVDNATLVIDQATNATLDNLIGGTGSVTKQGAGTLVLTGANTYAGGTTIATGTLQLGSGGASGSVVGDVTNNGVLAFNRSDADLSLSGAISGNGAVRQIGAGTTTLTGANTYTGATTITAGTLALTGTGAIAQSSGVQADGRFEISGTSAGAFITTLAGTGIVELGAQTLTLTQAANTFAGVIQGGGHLTVAGGAEVVTGSNTYSGGTTLAGGTLQLGDGGTTGSIVGDVIDNGTLIFNRSDAVAFDGAISGAGAIAKLNTNTTTLTGDSSSFTGATSIHAGTLVVNGVLGGTMDVRSGARLQGDGSVGATINRAGAAIAPGATMGTLTVAGNYASQDGLLEIESALAGDASPTDRLVVTGDTSGSTAVRLINRAGLGAQTVEGIKVVDVGGVSNGAFSLLGDYMIQGQPAVVAGAYGYVLQKNGLTTPADGDWYLRSSLLNPEPDPTTPVDPAVPDAIPLYQPGVPVYEAYPQALLALNALPTLRERVGIRAEDGVTAASIASPMIWSRIEGGHGHYEARKSTSGTDHDLDTWNLQSGFEGSLYEGHGGTLVAGVTAHYGTGSTDLTSGYGTGSIETAGYGVGGALTWYADNGFYIDNQARVTGYDSDLSSAVLGRLNSGNDGFGYGLGVETGRRIDVNETWALTPQAQLAYSAVEFDRFTDPFGADVALDRADSLKGRLGVSADYRKIGKDESGRINRTHVYGIANLTQEFLNGARVNVSDSRFVNANERLWGGLGLGGNCSWADGQYAFHAEASVDSNLSQLGESYALNATAGFNFVW
jgi:fibronectin-binding autotransporter adhesin